MKPSGITRRRWLRLGAASLLTPLAGRLALAARANTVPAPQGGGYRWRSWSGINDCRVQAIDTPGSEAELAGLMRAALASKTPVRCVGAVALNPERESLAQQEAA